jgi:hypothetical protein
MFAWRACEIDSPEAGKKLAKEHALVLPGRGMPKV